MPLGHRWTTLAAAALVGCAARAAGPPPASVTVVMLDRSALPLDAIGPAPRLPAPPTRPAARPPTDAVVAYAAGIDALVRDRPADAVAPLRRAAALDPDAIPVQHALGQALTATGDADAADVLTRAADLAPDDVTLQADVARALLAADHPDAAVARLRLALLTPGYRDQPGRAAVVDLLLARALAAAGYDRAALDRYARLLARFHDDDLPLRDEPDLLAVAEHPADLLAPIGQLYDRHGQWTPALRAYAAAAQQDPDRSDVRRAAALDRARLGRAGDPAMADLAVQSAAAEVIRDAASPASLSLLAAVCHELNRPDGPVQTLRQLADAHPDNRPVLLALVDRLTAAGRPAEAIARLTQAVHRWPADPQLAARLTALHGPPALLAPAP